MRKISEFWTVGWSFSFFIVTNRSVVFYYSKVKGVAPRDALLGYNNNYLRSKNDTDMSSVGESFRPSILEFGWEFFVLKYLESWTAFLTYIFPLYRTLDFGIGICIGVLARRHEKINLDKRLLVWNIVMNSGKICEYLFENRIIVGIGNMSETIFLTHLPVISYMKVLWKS